MTTATTHPHDLVHLAGLAVKSGHHAQAAEHYRAAGDAFDRLADHYGRWGETPLAGIMRNEANRMRDRADRHLSWAICA